LFAGLHQGAKRAALFDSFFGTYYPQNKKARYSNYYLAFNHIAIGTALPLQVQ
jgi:hypothetical protein